MTTTALPAPALSSETLTRLDVLRPHTIGADRERVTALVEQSFRNFPTDVPTATLIEHLLCTG